MPVHITKQLLAISGSEPHSQPLETSTTSDLHAQIQGAYPALVVVVSRSALEAAVQVAWSAETSSAPDWGQHNSAKGQCAVTACVVQDHLGGDIVNSIATLPGGETVSHYFNVVDSETVDLTHTQFPQGTRFSDPQPKTEGFPSTRDYCLSYNDTRRRYDTLRARVSAYLSGGDSGDQRAVHNPRNSRALATDV